MVSKTIRQNPLQLTTLQKNYERALLKGFRKFKSDALVALSYTRNLEERFLEPNFDLSTFDDQMDRYIQIDILQPSKAIIEDYDTKAYKQGSVFAERQLKNIGIVIALGVDTPIDQNVIKNLISKDISNLKNITQTMSTQIMRELSQGNQAGESYNKMAARLVDRWSAIGVTRAKTLTRTETQFAANEAAKTRYEQAGIEFAEWLTAADERVSDQDQNKNGIVFELAKGITNGALPGQGYSPRDSATIPPSHPNCRCAIVALTEAMVRARGLIK
jgi:SPP1 gp7 family putative phage head morphogenesis protein